MARYKIQVRQTITEVRETEITVEADSDKEAEEEGGRIAYDYLDWDRFPTIEDGGYDESTKVMKVTEIEDGEV